MEEEKIKQLQAPFKDIRWRIQRVYPSNNPTHCVCVPYIDARAVQKRLDDVVGVGNWQNAYDPISGAATLEIRVGKEWISKCDVGTDSNVEKEKGKASDAFKRAAVLWGIGRDLYSIGEKSLPYNAKLKSPMDIKGTIPLRTPINLSNYLNGINESMGLLYQIWNLNKDKQVDDEFKELFSSLKNYLDGK